jgi:hypothetical protein
VEVTVLDGVGHGTVLAGRFRLEERLQVAPGTSLWRAVDVALERPVGVRVVSGQAAADALDAARRAAVVDDPRLLRVLDVGTETVGTGPGTGQVAYVVSELVAGESLAERLRSGPLPAARVRVLVGEAARALATASQAGLHHTRLTPASLVLGTDGAVKVAGLAVDATLAGPPDSREDVDPHDAAAASRADAVGLVALLYAGLTGRWPFGSVDGVPAAPLVAGRPVPPADIVPGVPNDLDTLCAVTLGPHGDGPRTPAELADELAPWDRSTTVDDAVVTGPDVEGPDVEEPGTRPPSRFPVQLAAGTTGPTAAFSSPDPAGGAGLPDDDVTVGRSRRTQTAVALVVVAALVVAGLYLAVGSLRTIGERDPAAAPVTPTSSAAPSVEPTPTPTRTPTATASPQLPAPQVQGVRTLDPLGDGEENDGEAPRAVDGDDATAWTSSTYSTAAFGNLKDGLGLAVDLGRPSLVSGVDLLVRGSGGVVEVRSAPGPGVEDSEVLATVETTGEAQAIDLETPVETQYLVLWFTTLPQVGGDYRVELATVGVR